MKLLTTLSLLLIGIAAFAQNVSLTIFNNSGQQFFVIMNGIRQNSLPQTNVRIGGMTTGSYEVKLIFADGKTGDINKKIYFDTPADYLGRVVFKGKKGKLQYFGEAEGTQLPANGTHIQYRPNDQSGYSDQSSTMNTSGSGQTGSTSTQQTSQGTGQTTYGSGTMESSSNGTSTQQTGSTTGTQTISTGTTVTDPTGMNGGMQTTTTTTGTQTSTMSTGTTITDPNNPGGQFGVNINVQDPTMGGTGGISTTTTTTGMPSGNGSMGTSTTIIDPNNTNAQYGVSVSGTGMGNSTSTATSTTSSSSSTTQNGQVVNDSYNYQQTTSVTQNGQTTTQTYQSGKDYPGAPGTTGSGTFVTGQGTATPPAGTNYSCTSVLVDADAFIAELNAQTFDVDKRSLIETNLKSYCVSSDQAYRIIHALTFDADKIDMSKFLYDRMTDKVNGKRLLELLTFDADKQDFKNYMKTH